MLLGFVFASGKPASDEKMEKSLEEKDKKQKEQAAAHERPGYIPDGLGVDPGA